MTTLPTTSPPTDPSPQPADADQRSGSPQRFRGVLRPLHWISAGYGLLYLTLWLVDRQGFIQMTPWAWGCGIGLALLGQTTLFTVAILRPSTSRDWRWLGIGLAGSAMLQFGAVAYFAPTATPVLMIGWLVNLSHAASFLGLRTAGLAASVMWVVYAGAVWLAVEPDDTRPWVAILMIFAGAELYTIASHAGLHHRIWKRELQSRELIARAPVGLFRTDPDGRCLYVNQQWQRLAGMSLREALGDGWAERLHSEDRDAVGAAWREAMVTGGSFEAEYRFQGPDGRETWLLGRSAPVEDQTGRIVEWVGSITDITDRVVAEAAAEQASRVKTDFLANMSHEIRTPIAGIVGASELLSKQTEPADARTYVDVISTSAESLLQLIDGLLDFSKIEAGQLAFDEVDFCLVDAVESAVHMLRARALSKGIELDCRIAAGVPRDVHGDPLRLHQVLVNLVSNAIKFTLDGGVRLRVEVVDRPDRRIDGTWLRFEVADTGIGIDDEALGRLFEPFVQADSSMSRHFGGSGLGLSICKRIVDLAGGEIEVRSTLGEGSTFTVHLPYSEPRGVSGPASEEIPRRGVILRRRYEFNILLAEDNPVNRMIAVAQLDDLGYRVTAVENGVDVLDALGREPFDLVLMDCQMPELDGYETTRKIRQLGVGAGHLPIIAVTAHAVAGDRQRALDAGMDDYITKPYESRLLDTTISRWLWVDER